MIQNALLRPGRAPHLSDCELVTTALYQELIGEPREDHFFRLYEASLRIFFPGRNERSRYNRRKRALWSVILSVRASLNLVQESLCAEETAVIDSAPVPCVSYKRSKQASDFVGTAAYGVCKSKELKYFGDKFHSLVSLNGLILGFLHTGANNYDNQPVVDLLESCVHHLQRVLGDGAYNDAAFESYLEQSRSLVLLSPAKANQTAMRPETTQKQLNRFRLICETVNAQLHLSKYYAKSTWGLITRIATKVTAHSVATMVNTLLGRPALHLADLAV